jgi:hypothetical protein
MNINPEAIAARPMLRRIMRFFMGLGSKWLNFYWMTYCLDDKNKGSGVWVKEAGLQPRLYI